MTKFIPANPGYFAIWADEVNGEMFVFKSEIIAWRVGDEGIERICTIDAQAGGVPDLFVLCPDGHVEDTAGLYFETYEKWAAHVGLTKGNTK